MPTSFKTPRRPVLLVILDGFGINPSKTHNAVALADTPHLDRYFASYPHTMLHASGNAVGLPDGQMGNSEVGHLTLGCGEVIKQNLVLIDDAIRSGQFFSNPALLAAVQSAAERERPLHLFGLVSDGGVHSHIRHLQALIRLCEQHKVKPVLHMITDGRDTAQQSALNYINDIEPRLIKAGGHIATIMGRYYAMDRDNRWERIQLAWQTLRQGEAPLAPSARSAVEHAYANNQHDEFITPTRLSNGELIQADDPVICFNFRKDRAIQMVKALSASSFTEFERPLSDHPQLTCMMPYDSSLSLPVAFQPDRPATTLGQTVSECGLQQFHCAETEKYAHVTYFFNGGRRDPYSGESQCLIPSPNVDTYDLAPAMSAEKVADATINAMTDNKFSLLVVNFANGDMVGHSAVPEATIQAVEALDLQVGRLLDAAKQHDYSVVLTADHGNCEEMVHPITGAPNTQHTNYPVPCMVIDKQMWQLSCTGGLANIAPTILQLMGLVRPASMEPSLLIRAYEQQENDYTTAMSEPMTGAA